jgi:hypothetical protein
MSATRDKNQKVTFIYKNFHHLYKQGTKNVQDAARSAEVRVESHLNPSGQVLKVEDLNSQVFGVVKVAPYSPPEFLGKRVARPAVLPAAKPAVAPVAAPTAALPTNPAIESLKENLKSLNDLHGRLRFMLQELEELVREDDRE